LRGLRISGGNAQAQQDVLRSPVISQLRAQEGAVSQREAELVARYDDRHPAVVSVRAELRNIERALLAEVGRIAANVQSEWEVAQAGANALEASLREVGKATSADDRVNVRLRELERVALVNKTLFEDFLPRAKITEGRSTFEVREARLISQATPPSTPSYPSDIFTIAFGLVAGLALGAGAAATVEGLSQGFTAPREIEEKLDLPVLASIKRMSAEELSVGGIKLQMPRFLVAKPRSQFAEAIRSIRTGVQMTDVDRAPKVIQLTSAIPGEGKTMVSTSIAVAAALAGQKVALVDGDFRHPSVTRFFGLEASPGVVDVLLGNLDLSTITHVDETGVHVFGSGSNTHSPPDLLGSSRMRGLIDSLRCNYDLVVIDTPPIGPVIDAAMLASIADRTIFVVHWGRTARDLVGDAVRQIPGKKKIAGVVLNFVNEREVRKHGKYADGSRYYKSYYLE
jgi:capsular exopolysaccharide synthesis family protein